MTTSLRGPGGSPRRPARKPRSAFGLAVLLDIFDGDRDAIGRLLDAALGALHRDAAAIEMAARTNDRAALFTAGHRLKGTSGAIGARRLLAIGTRIPIGASPRLLLELRAALELVAAEIATYKAN